MDVGNVEDAYVSDGTLVEHMRTMFNNLSFTVMTNGTGIYTWDHSSAAMRIKLCSARDSIDRALNMLPLGDE